MGNLILELSKYILVIFIALYTLECFVVFRYENLEERNGIYIRQDILIFLVHFIGFATIALQKKDIAYWFLYVFEAIIFFTVIILYRMIYPKGNRLTINNMCMLLSIGCVILARLSLDKAIRQFVIIVAALIFAMVIPHFIQKLRFLKNFTIVYGSVGIALLLMVLIVGAVTNGSKISYTIAGVSFQPSEFVKIIYVFFLACMLANADKFVNILLSALGAGAHVMILVLSRDLGSALIFAVVYLVMLFVATKNYWYLLLGGVAGSGAAFLAYRLFSHVQTRVMAWKNPWADLNGMGYQITQSLFAIGTGGWFGLGLLGGTPKSIPYVEADFIFSAIAEEMGVLFAICIILISLSCFILFMNIAMKLNDRFYRLIAVGLGVTYGFQIFLTIGGGTKLIPLTGVTLPLISYGGSSILSTLIMFAIIQGLYIIHKEQGEKRERRKKLRKGRSVSTEWEEETPSEEKTTEE